MSQPTAVPLDHVDLTDLDAFARNEGWAMFDTLRAEDPVHWTPEAPPNSGFWAVTRYADIDAVDRDGESFTSTKYVNLEEVDDDLMDLRRSMLETDGLRHRALRKLIQREFSQGPLTRKYEEFLRGSDDGDRRQCAAEPRIRLCREDQRRLSDQRPRPATRRTGERYRHVDQLGQSDGRQHRSGLHGAFDHRPGQ